MVDRKTHFEPLDPGRIDIQSEEEMHYWAHELHCTPSRLLQVVKRVGNHVTAVREYLHQHPASASHAHSPPHRDEGQEQGHGD